MCSWRKRRTGVYSYRWLWIVATRKRVIIQLNCLLTYLYTCLFTGFYRVSQKSTPKAVYNISAYAKPFWAKFCPAIGNLYPHKCSNFEESVLKFKEFGVQNGAPAYTADVTQNWLRSNCSDCINKDEWPPNSPDLGPLNYHVWGGQCCRLTISCSQNPKQFRSWRTHCRVSGLPCHRNPLLKVQRTSASDSGPVCQLMGDILNVKSDHWHNS